MRISFEMPVSRHPLSSSCLASCFSFQKSELAFQQEHPSASDLMDTCKILLKSNWKTISFGSPWILKKLISNQLQHWLMTGEQWLLKCTVQKNRMKRTVNLVYSSLYTYLNANSTLGENYAENRDTAVTNIKSSYQCISWDKLCSERSKSSNVAAIRHLTVWSVSICVIFSGRTGRLHFEVWMHWEITMHYIHGFGYRTSEFHDSYAAEYSRIMLFCNGNGKAKRGLFHCMLLILKTCMWRSGRVHLSL